jgi:hypothetical protein
LWSIERWCPPTGASVLEIDLRHMDACSKFQATARIYLDPSVAVSLVYPK